MPEEVMRIIIAGIIGITITVSMVAMAVSRIFASRRRGNLSDASVVRLEARLERMEQAIDAMATEVERVAEGQRFTSRLLAERQVERQP
jgi:hypothetical protein